MGPGKVRVTWAHMGHNIRSRGGGEWEASENPLTMGSAEESKKVPGIYFARLNVEGASYLRSH